MSSRTSDQTLRIIGGKWRGRKIRFPPVAGLRPTPDRVRETLFNWLAGDVVDAACLDPFAGSGALSLEALSRGARHGTLIERSSSAAASLKDNLSLLGVTAQDARLLVGDARQWLQPGLSPKSDGFDLIFLDPPFSEDPYPWIRRLMDARLLAAHGAIYVETASVVAVEHLPHNLSVKRTRCAGAVHFSLLALERAAGDAP